MTCTGCASTVEKSLRGVEGVETANVNFAGNTAWVEFQEEASIEKLIAAVKGVGYKLKLPAKDPSANQSAHEKKLLINLIISAVFTLPVFIIGMFMLKIPYANEIMFACTAVVLATGGRQFFIKAFKLATKFRTNMDSLVALGTGAAFIYSTVNTFWPNAVEGSDHIFFEGAAVVVTLILFGRYLEEKAKRKTGDAIRALIDLRPDAALVKSGDDYKEVAVSEVKKGDMMLLKAGMRVPVDGIVFGGESWFDESMVTGEPDPVRKGNGDALLGGTVNGDGRIEFYATATGNESFLARVIEQVKSAQASKAPVQKLVDQISSVFVPVVMLISIAAFVGWWFSGVEDARTMAIVTAVSTLVVACPCALGLATPAAVSVVVGLAARRGVLIRNAEALEKLAGVKKVFSDKTGTITMGKPEVAVEEWSSNEDESKWQAVAKKLAGQSDHPLSQAIHGGQSEGTPIFLANVETVRGAGIMAEYENGQVALGNMKWMKELGMEVPQSIQEWEDSNEIGSRVYFAGAGQVRSIYIIRDRVRKGAAEAVKELGRMGIEVTMLTGDNEVTAAAVAEETGIMEFRASMLPSDKLEAIRGYGGVSAMIGDGINDSPALAAADVGVAVGDGTDVATETAGMVLAGGGIEQLPVAIRIARLGRSTIRQNLFWAFIYNVSMIPLAVGLLYPVVLDPMLAGFAMAMSSLSVMLNSISIRWRFNS